MEFVQFVFNECADFFQERLEQMKLALDLWLSLLLIVKNIKHFHVFCYKAPEELRHSPGEAGFWSYQDASAE